MLTCEVKFSRQAYSQNNNKLIINLIIYVCSLADLLPRIEPESENAGMCLTIGDGPTQIFTKLRTRLIEEIGWHPFVRPCIL